MHEPFWLKFTSQGNSYLAKVDKEFGREFALMQDQTDKVNEPQVLVEISAPAVHDSRQEYHRLASAFDEVEGTLNEGLSCIHKLMAEMTTATSAMSNGTRDRSHGQRARVLTKCPRPAEQDAQ